MATYPLRQPVFVTDPDGELPTEPVQTIAGGYSYISLDASGVAFAAPGTVVRVKVNDKGTSGSYTLYDNASAGSGTNAGTTKITSDGQVMEEGIAMANGCYVTLAGSAKVTVVYKAD